MGIITKRTVKPKGMRRPYKKVYRRRPLRRLGTQRSPYIRNAFSQKEWASHSEVQHLDTQIYESNTLYNQDVSLNMFTRATRIAQNYREFRITGVKFIFKPRYDTFAATTNEATATPIPQFYYMIDRNGTLNPGTVTEAQLLQMGARPKRFDDKNIVVMYKPAVVVGLWDELTQPNPVFNMKRISPWLSTNSRVDSAWNPSVVNHKGLYWYLDSAALPGDGTYEYDVDIEVNFQFRGPLSVATPASSAPM